MSLPPSCMYSEQTDLLWSRSLQAVEDYTSFSAHASLSTSNLTITVFLSHGPKVACQMRRKNIHSFIHSFIHACSFLHACMHAFKPDNVYPYYYGFSYEHGCLATGAGNRHFRFLIDKWGPFSFWHNFLASLHLFHI